MRTALAVFLVLALLAPAADAGITVKKVHGDLEAQDGSEAVGRFALLTVTSGGSGLSKLVVFAEGLDPETVYQVHLGDESGWVWFGDLVFRGSKGYAAYKFNSLRDEYPEGVTSLAEFSGRSMLVALEDGTPVLSGAIPAFVAPGTGEDPAEDSIAVGAGVEKLSPPEGADTFARGLVTALAVNVVDGVRERLGVAFFGLETGEEYSVYLAGDEPVLLGTVTPRGFFGIGRLVLDTGRGDTLPDHLGALSGRGLEIRDSGDEVVLSGVVPSLE